MALASVSGFFRIIGNSQNHQTGIDRLIDRLPESPIIAVWMALGGPCYLRYSCFQYRGSPYRGRFLPVAS